MESDAVLAYIAKAIAAVRMETDVSKDDSFLDGIGGRISFLWLWLLRRRFLLLKF